MSRFRQNKHRMMEISVSNFAVIESSWLPDGDCLTYWVTEGEFLCAFGDSSEGGVFWELVAALRLLSLAVVVCKFKGRIADARRSRILLWRIERDIEAASDMTCIFLDLCSALCFMILLLATKSFLWRSLESLWTQTIRKASILSIEKQILKLRE